MTSFQLSSQNYHKIFEYLNFNRGENKENEKTLSGKNKTIQKKKRKRFQKLFISNGHHQKRRIKNIRIINQRKSQKSKKD